MKNVSEEFIKGKNNIGYVDSDFTREFGSDDLTEGKVLKFDTLKRSMLDSEIIKEFKVQECTLGDVLETLKNAPETIKDGYANLFYIKGHASHVVSVYWNDVEWRVCAWHRVDGRWDAGTRVFSPATSDSNSLPSSPSASFDTCECERCKKCGKLVK